MMMLAEEESYLTAFCNVGSFGLTIQRPWVSSLRTRG